MKKLLLQLGFVCRGVLYLVAWFMLVQPCAGTPAGFEATGSLVDARALHTATLLPDDKVLVAGGGYGYFLASAELYDSDSETWATTGSLGTARILHMATLLSTGKVLVSGGAGLEGDLASAELYDPGSGAWTPTGSLISARFGGSATLLPSGEVLVAGGSIHNDGATVSISEAELYNPASGTWTATASMANARDGHTATLLPNGEVLVVGGYNTDGNLDSAELYEPASGTWTTTGSLVAGSGGSTATLLTDGKVLVAGSRLSSALYDPESRIWSTTGGLTNERSGHTATLLANGEVLVAGGYGDSGLALGSAELYDPATGMWSPTGGLADSRYSHTATLLANGEVLVAGGVEFSDSYSTNILRSVELYDPVPPVIVSPSVATATMSLPFSYQLEAVGATSFETSDLPDGLTLDPALRAIIGTATVEGIYQVDFTASNSFGTTNGTVTINAQPLPTSGPVIISITSASGLTGIPFDFQVITAGGSSATRVSATGLPSGLSIDAVTGEITGTPALDGSYPVTLSVTDQGETNTATLQLTFSSDFGLPRAPSPFNVVLYPGVPFDGYYVGSSPPNAVIGALPPGLVFDPATGYISGTPQFTSQPTPALAGPLVSNVQIFECNSNGCVTGPLLFELPTGAANISTRLSVGTGDNVLIGGFITQGNAPMKLVVRGIGPSLLGVSGVLADPYLELHSGMVTLASNDNWKDNLAGGNQEEAIKNTGLMPTNDLESAILSVLDPGSYTAIMHGTNNGTGVGLVEVYNLGAASMDVSGETHLVNISTRGFVQTGDNVMIGGFINQGATPTKVLIRGIGPTLTQAGVKGALANPVLELHGPRGGTIATNDDWVSDPTQKSAILATGLAPANGLESAILFTLPVGEDAYTAIVSGVNGTAGIGLVEAYFGNPCLGTSCP